MSSSANGSSTRSSGLKQIIGLVCMVLCLPLVVLGIYLMGLAFSLPGAEVLVFCLGLAVSFAAWWLFMEVVPWTDGPARPRVNEDGTIR